MATRENSNKPTFLQNEKTNKVGGEDPSDQLKKTEPGPSILKTKKIAQIDNSTVRLC